MLAGYPSMTVFDKGRKKETRVARCAGLILLQIGRRW